MRTHLKTHSGEKSNKCNQCDFASALACYLRTHLKTQSQTNVRRASVLQPSQAGNLWGHLKLHGGGKQVQITPSCRYIDRQCLLDIHILGQIILNWFGELCFKYVTQIACMRECLVTLVTFVWAPPCMLSNVSSNCLIEKMHTGCNCLTFFPLCFSSNASSNCLPQRMSSRIGCTFFPIR